MQTLSRLNRIYPGKQETFVLDFVNEAEGIQQAFQPYFEHASVDERADPRQLYDLRTAIYALHIVFETEVEQFAAAFFRHHRKQTPTDHALLNSIVDKAVTRYQAADPQEAANTRDDFGYALYQHLEELVVNPMDWGA